MTSGWAQLPDDLLTNIFMRMTCAEDMASLSCVCLSWTAVTRIVKPMWSPAAPLFMIPSITAEDPSTKWTLYNPITRKDYKLDLAPTTGCFPSCVDGWIFDVQEESGDIYFFNPFTKDRISLPPMYKMPGEFPGWKFYNYREVEVASRGYRLRSVIMVKVPLQNEFYVFGILDLCWLVFAKHGDTRWSYVDCAHEHQGERIFLETMIYRNGQIVILYGDGKLVGLDLDHLITYNKVVVAEEYVVGDVDGDTSIYAVEALKHMYLVEHFGNILLVLQYGLSVKRFKTMEFDEKEKVWVELQYVRDVSLFIGAHSAMAICASNAVPYQPNYVYYTGDDYCLPTMGIAVLNRGVGQTFHPCANVSKLAVPFWFMPNYNKC